MPPGCLYRKTPGTRRNGLSSAPGTSCFMPEHLYIHRNEHLPSSKRKRNAMTTDHKAEMMAPFQAAWSLKAILIFQNQDFWRGPQCLTVGEMGAGVFEIWRTKNLTLSQREERHRTSGPFLQATSERRTLQPLMLYPQFMLRWCTGKPARKNPGGVVLGNYLNIGSLL